MTHSTRAVAIQPGPSPPIQPSASSAPNTKAALARPDQRQANLAALGIR